jgi:hypothetical protein
MQRTWMMGVLMTTILACSAGAAQAVAHGRMMDRSMHAGMCPKKADAVVILSKDPFCAAHHLTGDPCQENWVRYWGMTAEYNNFLAQCRWQRKWSHLQ